MKLHDSTRRFLSLLIFFLLGPLLTIGVLVGVGLRKLPSNAKRFEYELTKQTGIQWKIQKVEYRSPGCVRLGGVEIVDETTSKSIFETDYIDIIRHDDRNPEKYFSTELRSTRNESSILGSLPKLFSDGSNGFWLITIPNSVVKLDRYGERSADVVWGLLSKFLARFPQLSEMPIQLVMENVGVFSEAGRNKTGKHKFEPLRFVRGNLYRSRDGVRSDWSFQMPEVSQLETQQLSIVRFDSGDYEFALRTGSVTIPCDLAAVFCSAFAPFGSGSRFGGYFLAHYHGEGTKARTVRLENALFQNIDVSHIAAAYTSFDVSGTVETLRINKAAFGPEVFFADGYFKVVKGDIDTTLFNRFVQQFELTVRPGEIVDTSRSAIPYDESAVFFRLQADGAEFWPDEQWKEGMFMYRLGDGVRLQQMTVHFPTAHRRPVSFHAILSLLAPDTAPVVPLTPGLKNIYSVIPVADPRVPTTTSPKSARTEIMATTTGGSPIMTETIKNADRFTASEPLPSLVPAKPASPYPVIANPAP